MVEQNENLHVCVDQCVDLYSPQYRAGIQTDRPSANYYRPEPRHSSTESTNRISEQPQK